IQRVRLFARAVEHRVRVELAELEAAFERSTLLVGELGEQRESVERVGHGTSLAKTVRSTSSRSWLEGGGSTEKEPPSRCRRGRPGRWGSVPRAESVKVGPGGSGGGRCTERGLRARRRAQMASVASSAAPNGPAGRTIAPSMPFAATSQSGS